MDETFKLWVRESQWRSQRRLAKELGVNEMAVSRTGRWLQTPSAERVGKPPIDIATAGKLEILSDGRWLPEDFGYPGPPSRARCKSIGQRRNLAVNQAKKRRIDQLKAELSGEAG